MSEFGSPADVRPVVDRVDIGNAHNESWPEVDPKIASEDPRSLLRNY